MKAVLRIVATAFALLYQSIAQALAHIWANKVRSLLTMVGIIIGVASVTGVIAAMTGLKKKVLADFETVGTNKIFINVERPRTGPKKNLPWRSLRFRPEQFDDLLRHCPSVKTFTRTMWLQDKVRYGDRMEENVNMSAIEPAWHEIENRSVIEGRQFTVVDMESARAVCLINPTTRTKLQMPKDCVGQSITIGDRRYTVVGVIEPAVALGLFGSSEAGMEVLIPFSTGQRKNPWNMSVTAAARSPEVAEEARAELAFYLRKLRHIQPGEPDTFRLDMVQKFIDTFNQTAATMTLVAVGIVGISLLVGGVGIMNIMLVSVSERTREIGLRKAVGARPAAILFQFLVEAVTLCFVGGMVGVMGGYGIARLIAGIPGARLDKAEVPLWAVGLSFGFAAAVGLIFGMFPAIKAARLDPIDALRHE
ncbi:MAG: ABC transporter permease [Candidatus Sumerlaeaceae bacterium]|nr:ABC transporter permease [Candidatus Sumerlaeaceae bacterium]